MVKEACKLTPVVEMSSPMKDMSSSGDSINTKATMKMESMRWYDSDSEDESISDNSHTSDESANSSRDSESKATTSTADNSFEADLSGNTIVEEEPETTAEKENGKNDRGIFAVLNPNNVADESSTKRPPAPDAQVANHQQLEELLLKVATKDKELSERNNKIIELHQEIAATVEKTAATEAEAMSKLNEKMESLEAENTRLSEKLETAYKAVEEASKSSSSFASIAGRGVAHEKEMSHQKEMTKREEELTKSRETVKHLEGRIQELQEAQKEVKSLQDSVKNIRDENSTLLAETNQLKNKLADVEKNGTSAAEKNSTSADIRAQLSAAKAEAKDARGDLLQLRSVMKDLEMMQAKAYAEVAAGQEQRDRLASRIPQLESEIEQLNRQVKELQAAQTVAPVLKEEEPKAPTTKVVGSKKQHKKRKPKKCTEKTSNSEDEFLASLVAERNLSFTTSRQRNVTVVFSFLVLCITSYFVTAHCVGSRTSNPALGRASSIIEEMKQLRAANERLTNELKESRNDYADLTIRSSREKGRVVDMVREFRNSMDSKHWLKQHHADIKILGDQIDTLKTVRCVENSEVDDLQVTYNALFGQFSLSPEHKA